MWTRLKAKPTVRHWRCTEHPEQEHRHDAWVYKELSAFVHAAAVQSQQLCLARCPVFLSRGWRVRRGRCVSLLWSRRRLPSRRLISREPRHRCVGCCTINNL